MAASNELAEDFVERAVKVYREYATVASVTTAKVSLLNRGSRGDVNEFSIVSKWSQRDLERNESRSFLRSHIASYEPTAKSITNIREPSFPAEVQNLQLSSLSPSGKLQAIVRKVPGKSGQEEKQFLEIWSSGNLFKSVDVQAFDKHRKICEGSQFGCLAWSSNEQFLLYVAEKKLPKAVSYFERQKPSTGDSSDNQGQEKGSKFEFKDDWGEQLVSKCSPILAIFDVTKEEVRVLDGVPDHLSAGQACWGPDDNSVVFVGWFNKPYKLGLIYCPIRKSALFSLSLDQANSLEQLTDVKYAVHSPRFNHAKDKLIYIALDVGGAHCKCGRLMQYDWKSKVTSTIVDVVDVPERGGFPGIYSRGLSERCWTKEGNAVAISTPWRSSQKIILVNCTNKTVTDLTTAPGSWSLLDVNSDIILASHSAPNSPPRLMVATLPDEVPESGLSWIAVAQSSDLNLEKEITWTLMTCKPSEQSDFQEEYEAVLIKPVMKDSKKPALVVFSHGGPHTAYTLDFSLYIACFCKLGFAILSVNYRGSLGFGQSSLHSLPGNVGTQDVQDVQRVAVKVLASGEVDTSNVFVMGGSHGGFLTTHLIGQYPDFYRAAATRNPVVNVAAMASISDIPDWCFFEAGHDFSHDSTPTPQMLTQMLQFSPISHVKKVKTPTLILVGEKDLRVPSSQGKMFYKLLKAQGTDTRLLSYSEDNHPLSRVETESDAFINIARWFHEHLNN
ncbi:acylamino-acid-releasing enzyme-like isoform X2 [Porites lutea]|uniref:acylamino-acid-releasing enzyme-like isoform X2 n=1 Tax=Porites lutea TaxID=51062 RepID=UPI003CC69687